MSSDRTPWQLIAAAGRQLSAAGVDTPEVDARALLAAAAEVEPSKLLLTHSVADSVTVKFWEWVNRRADREPLQHLTGVAHFRHVQVRVGPGVFVPRPETEVMAGWVVDQLRERCRRDSAPVVLDLGTGSGAIAKAIADEAPGCTVYAVEQDGAAAWAAENLAGTGVELRIADLTDRRAISEMVADMGGEVDLVVCNPPYIPLWAWESVQPEARDHDPFTALFAGDDGLDVIRRVVGLAAELLGDQGMLACEHAELQTDSVPALVAASGDFDVIQDHDDLTGRPRYVTARRRRSSGGRTWQDWRR